MNYSMMVSALPPSRTRDEEREKYKERILWNSVSLCLVRGDGIPFSANPPISAICLLIMSAGSLLIKCVHQRERERDHWFLSDFVTNESFEQARRRVSPFSSKFPPRSKLLGPEFDPVHVRLSDIKDDGGASLLSWHPQQLSPHWVGRVAISQSEEVVRINWPIRGTYLVLGGIGPNFLLYSRKPGLGNQPAENTSNNVIQTCSISQEEDSQISKHFSSEPQRTIKWLRCARSHQLTITALSINHFWPRRTHRSLQFLTNLKHWNRDNGFLWIQLKNWTIKRRFVQQSIYNVFQSKLEHISQVIIFTQY